MRRNAEFFADSDYLDKWVKFCKSYVKWQNDHSGASHFPPRYLNKLLRLIGYQNREVVDGR